MEGRLEYRGVGGLDFHHHLLDNAAANANYSHLQRSIDSLRSLGDRAGNSGLELNLSLGADRLGLERLIAQEQHHHHHQQQHQQQQQQQQQHHHHQHQQQQQQQPQHHHHQHRMGLELLQNNNNNSTNSNAGLQERLGGGYERLRLDQNGVGSGGGSDSMRLNHHGNDSMGDKYRAHLDNLRSTEGGSRSMEGTRTSTAASQSPSTEQTTNAPTTQDEEREGATPSTPPTPISVGENFQEEKVPTNQVDLWSQHRHIIRTTSIASK